MHVPVLVKTLVIKHVCIHASILVPVIAEALAKVHAKGLAKTGVKMPQKTILNQS